MRTTTRQVNFGLQNFSGLYLWAMFVVVFGIWKTDLFLTPATLHSVASSQAISAMLALALLIPLTAGIYDLSVGAVINVSAVTVINLQTMHHVGMWTAMLITVLMCAGIGAVSGFIVVTLKVNSFVATLGMATIVSALQSIISGQSQPYPPTALAWFNLTQRSVFGFQIVVVYLLVLALLVWLGPGPHTRRALSVRDRRQHRSGAALGPQRGALVMALPRRLGLHRRSGRHLLRIPVRAIAHLRSGTALAGFCCGVPRVDPGHSGATQRLGHDAGRLRSCHRRSGPPVRHRRPVAQRHVQRRGTHRWVAFAGWRQLRPARRGIETSESESMDPDREADGRTVQLREAARS